MSMPVIKPSCTSRCQSITDIIESVALEQTALSHILNAEGEKIQKVLEMRNISACELLEINKSVQQTINSITRLEVILELKLELFSCKNCENCKNCSSDHECHKNSKYDIYECNDRNSQEEIKEIDLEEKDT